MCIHTVVVKGFASEALAPTDKTSGLMPQKLRQGHRPEAQSNCCCCSFDALEQGVPRMRTDIECCPRAMHTLRRMKGENNTQP